MPSSNVLCNLDDPEYRRKVQDAPAAESHYCLWGASSPWSAASGIVTFDTLSMSPVGRSQLEALGLLQADPYYLGPVTIEMRIKLDAASEARGFGLQYIDGIGRMGIVLSPDGVETTTGVKPFSFARHQMETTDGFHTYRLVRKGSEGGGAEGYFHLYVDGVPVIVDHRLDMSHYQVPERSDSLLVFGIGGGDGTGSAQLKYRIDPQAAAKVQIDYIRWKAEAHAPPS